MAKKPTALEEEITTLIIGADTLLGGDVLSERGEDHMIADTWISNEALPIIYYDKFAQQARRSSQERPGQSILADKKSIRQFATKYHLRELSAHIRQQLSRNADGQETIDHKAKAIDAIIRTVLSESDGTKPPHFDEKYLAVVGGITNKVELADPSEAREQLNFALSAEGYKMSRSRDLRETFQMWRAAQRILNNPEIMERARQICTDLMQARQNNVFKHLNFGDNSDNLNFSDVSLKGCNVHPTTGVDFTGSLVYKGGEKEAKPALAAVFEYNMARGFSDAELLNLCAHEVIGHYVSAAIQDLRWRADKLDFITTIGTLCTPSLVFDEGWAQNMFELTYGSREEAAKVHGNSLLVALALEDLEDIAKHNVPILYQREGRSLEEVKEYVAQECAQPDEVVEKLSGTWTQHPIFGPMLGPSYLLGREVVSNAIQQCGTIAVAEIGYQLDGRVDICVFQEKVQERITQSREKAQSETYPGKEE